MEGEDDKTQPGAPRGLEGSLETRALAELAAMVAFFGSQLDQLIAEAKRGPLSAAQRTSLWRRVLELQDDFAKAAERLQRRAPASPEAL